MKAYGVYSMKQTPLQGVRPGPLDAALELCVRYRYDEDNYQSLKTV